MYLIERPNTSFDYNFYNQDFLPHVYDEYYEFEGSLTTPPCSEITTWIVFSHRMYISPRQV